MLVVEYSNAQCSMLNAQCSMLNAQQIIPKGIEQF